MVCSSGDEAAWRVASARVERGADVDIAAVAAVLASPARARMLLALGSGRRLTATALAAAGKVAPSTASVHLARLVESGMVRVEERGRRRYYQLGGSPVGDVIETLARIAPAATVSGLRDATGAQALRHGRICGDHLAGRLGVALTAGLLDQRVLIVDTAASDGAPKDLSVEQANRDAQRGVYVLTDDGARRLRALGLRQTVLTASPIDWHLDPIEGQPHLAGTLGASLLTRLLALDWIRHRGTPRAVCLSKDAPAQIRHTLGVDLALYPL